MCRRLQPRLRPNSIHVARRGVCDAQDPQRVLPRRVLSQAHCCSNPILGNDHGTMVYTGDHARRLLLARDSGATWELGQGTAQIQMRNTSHAISPHAVFSPRHAGVVDFDLPSPLRNVHLATALRETEEHRNTVDPIGWLSIYAYTAGGGAALSSVLGSYALLGSYASSPVEMEIGKSEVFLRRSGRE